MTSSNTTNKNTDIDINTVSVPVQQSALHPVAPDTVFNIATATTDPFSATTAASPPSSPIEQPRTPTLPPKSLPCSSPGNTTHSISPTPALPSPVSSAGRCSRAHPKRIENDSDGPGEGGEMVNNVSRSPTESVIGSERSREQTRINSHIRTDSGQSLPEPTFARPLLLPRSTRSPPDLNPALTFNFNPNLARTQTRLNKPRPKPQTSPERPIVLPPPQIPFNTAHSQHSQSASEPDEPTPNVYINGLPPNFPESDLWALAAPFGEVRSVRGFTRWVGGRASGYGFVLFDSVQSAMRCIAKLRERRDLHPSFSKMHKSLAGRTAAPGQNGKEITFKVKMERLADRNSTNLYFEGLPLSIDEPTLAALVSPYYIKSSRFFQTKLSDPPRIIAFVRLETRAAAEEIIERLHGRMVRGWNEPGCRISVRFADTSEQRDMRRQERLMNEGEGPNKISIAQATLLNLHGGQSPSPQQLYSRLPSSFPVDEFRVVPHGMERYGVPVPQTDHFRSVNPPRPQNCCLPPVANPGFDHGMKNVLQSMQMLNYGAHHSNEYNYNKALATYHALNDLSVPVDQPSRMQSGFTPIEERILRAHASGAEGYQSKLTSLPPTSENDFHASAQGSSSLCAPQPYGKLSSTSSDFAYTHNHDTGLHTTDSPNQNLNPAHLRSTTAPSSQFIQRSSSTSYHPRQHYSTVSFPPGNNTTHNNTINKNNNSIRANIYTGNQQNTIHDNTNNVQYSNPKQVPHPQAPHGYNQNPKNMNYDNNHTIPDSTTNSPLVSPSLTYSGRTPATLSPSTPFFGSFVQAQDNFKGIGQQLQDSEREFDGQEINIRGLMGGIQSKANLSVPVTKRVNN